MTQHIRISEVGLRDGLQSIDRVMPTEAKKAWILAEVAAGVTEMEVGSFVPPSLLPQMADTAQVLAYAKTKPVRDGLKAQKSPKAREAYRQAHESDFIIADAAARYFKAHGITRLPARKALQDEIEQLVSKKSSLYNTYHEQKQRYTELQTVKRNIDQILRRSEPHRRKEQSHER